MNRDLLVGYDSAWTSTKAGALAGLLVNGDGTFEEFSTPKRVDYHDAEETILEWQQRFQPSSTLVLIDQPTVVMNDCGQRPVEHIVSSAVSRRRGGMQPANRKRLGMFCDSAPIWPFLERFGVAFKSTADSLLSSSVFETYPVLTMVALGWTLQDSRIAGRLPKYNPARKKTFSTYDWNHVRQNVSSALRVFGLVELPNWIDMLSETKPTKVNQDALDACICLLVAIHLARGETMIVGDVKTGYIVVPHSPQLYDELCIRCQETKRIPSEWVRTYVRIAGRPNTH